MPVKYEEIAPLMRAKGVDVRKIFYPLSEMPPYKHHQTGPVAQHLSEYGISLPSYPELTNQEVDFVCESLLKSITYAQQNSTP